MLLSIRSFIAGFCICLIEQNKVLFTRTLSVVDGISFNDEKDSSSEKLDLHHLIQNAQYTLNQSMFEARCAFK